MNELREQHTRLLATTCACVRTVVERAARTLELPADVRAAALGD